MVFPTQQGTQSQTFKPPPPDFSLNLLEVHDFNAEHSPNHPLFRYMTDDETAQTIYWGESVQAFHVAQGFVQTLTPVTYYTLLMGIMHAGFVPFPISTRNSEAAVAHLLKVTNAVNVFANPDNAMQSLAQKACHQLGEGNGIQILPTPVFDDFYKPTQKDFKSSARSRKIELDETAFILHSSGSTSFPKPIKISHRNFLGHGIEPYYGETDYCGQVISAAAFPMFHMSAIILVPETAMVGLTMSVFRPKNIPIIPTPENLFKNALVTKCTIMLVVPSMLETWAKDPVKVEVLAKYTVVGFGGGPLVPAVGNELVEKGVTLRSFYGSTETGAISTTTQQAFKEGWEYFSKCETHIPSVLDTDIDGQPAFDTKDLLVRHPTNPGFFKIYGRADRRKDQPISHRILALRDEKITHAIMFGRAKLQAGVLITPLDALVFDPADTVKLAEYRNMIWDVVQRANGISPQHSKILKELIVVTTPSKPLELTAKGTPRRGSSLKAYEEEIEKAYQALEESSQPNIQAPAVWDTISVTIFITEVVENALGFKVHEHDDLFRVGADSLNATYIRNTITRALRDVKSIQIPLASIRALPENFVYDNASVAALSKFVHDIPHTYATGTGAGEEKDKEEDGDDDDDDPEGDYQWPKMGQPGETILQVRKGKGEPPLMIIHGAGGRADGMIHFQQKFRSALWLFQVTPDLPRKSLREHAEFYYRKVKELRPHGPYRLATYSGSHLIGFVMVEMMLKDGEEVIQFDMIDQSPSFMFSGVSEDGRGFGDGVDTVADSNSDSVQMNENGTARPDRPPLAPSFPNPNFNITSPSFRSTYKSRMIYGFYDTGAREGRTQILNVLKDAWEGRPAPDVLVELAETAKWSADESWDFVAGLPGYQESNAPAPQFKNTWERCLFAIEHWLKNISGISRVPITVYVASYGSVGGVKDETEKEKWKESGLGVRRCFPDARVVHVDTGHLMILANKEVHDFNAEHSPNHPLFRYMTDDETAQTIYWGEAVQAFHVAQGFVQTLVKNDHIDSQPPPVIAILATLDSVTYYTLLMGIMHAGFVPFPISTRNSEAAVAHLLKATNAVYVFANPDNTMQSLAQKACHRLGEGNGIQILPTPVFDDFYKPTQKDFKSSARSRKIELDDTAFILHSSGSTSFPKPIKISHRNFLGHGIEPYYSETDYCGQVRSAAGSPMFHMSALILVPQTAMVGIAMSVFQPKNIPVIPTPENVFKNALVTKCTIMTAVPSMLETWAKDPVKVEMLAKCTVVGFSGGPLVPAVGNELVEKGVTLRPFYGLTEIGAVTTQQAFKEGWEYFSKCETHTPSVLDTDIDGQPAFDTKDLLVRHPTNPGFFKIYGRAVPNPIRRSNHAFCEKTNPFPIESLLLRDERITYAIMFGRAKFQAGVLITPSNALVFDPADTVKLAEYRNMIWDVVQRANDISPQHSKIFKELIVVTNPLKPLELTAKATPRRGSSLKAYEEEIEKAYRALEESSQPNIQAPAVWDTISVTIFITEVVENALGFKLHEHDDFFRVGADSLNATYIRNTITRALRDLKSDQIPLASIRALPENFVYDNASVAALSKFILDIPHTYAAGTGVGEEKDKEDGDDDDDDPEGDYQWPKMGQPGETILQVRKGKGEPPLMIIPGAGGRADGMIHFQQKFRSALWLFQITPDLPRKSLREHAEFYYRKVKELRPHGPYRLAAYSGSHLIGFVMVEMMLKDGEEVIQFDLIDQSPSFMFSGLNEDARGLADSDSDSVQKNGNGTARPDRPPLVPSSPNPNFDITSPSFHSTYKSRMIRALYNMAAREGRTQILDAFKDAWEGRPAPDVSVEVAETAKWSVDVSLDLVAGLPGYQESNVPQFRNTWERCLFAIEHWLKNISGISRVPITVYVASYGAIGSVKDETEKEKWKESGLGVRRCFPDARVVHVDTGHILILENKEVEYMEWDVRVVRIHVDCDKSGQAKPLEWEERMQDVRASPIELYAKNREETQGSRIPTKFARPWY
ncbi:hypothetical protein D9758_007233 [Tetrapyrgos nigripes]|uniref:Polyketide synthase-like phosphopantetheine-binding domain-containing protein n=1 Tax=Tetrapyrgos nigripes TaxID=182062 RepID=A0A8H5D0V7_9AGAR|nr:hypothetical protein D9758_007233 [Tetrapyrgos nigripes]